MSIKVAIVGGGMAGLSAAWRLEQAGIRYGLVEREAHWGGKLHTEQLSLPDGQACILDAGPESFITRKPEVWQMAQALGLLDEVIAPGAETRGVNVLHGGVMYPLPLSPLAFLSSGLLSWRGKLRLLAEPFIAPRRDAGDETLADFARRRLGAEMTDRMIGPVLGGIYNADYEQQSVMVSAPQMRDMERQHGSLIRATLAMLRQRKAESGPKPPRFIAFRDGSSALVEGLLRHLSGDLRLHTSVRAIERLGAGYALHLSDGTTWQAESVILATPANVSAALLRPFAPQAAEALETVQHNSIGTLFLAYRSADLPESAVTSLMIPRRERRALDAVLWTSRRMPGRAPADYTLLKVFFGGAQPHTIGLDDEDLLRLIGGELRDLFGIDAKPLAHRAFRWHESYPQASVGHLEQVTRIEASLPHGLFVSGSSYRGIGVPDCIRQGYEAARAAAVWIGSSVTV